MKLAAALMAAGGGGGDCLAQVVSMIQSYTDDDGDDDDVDAISVEGGGGFVLFRCNVSYFCQIHRFQVVPGPATLLTPEPGLLVLGMKSYGRGSAFLLRLFDNFHLMFYVRAAPSFFVAITKQ